MPVTTTSRRSTPFKLKSFSRGVHPPECKDDTRDLAIRQFPFAPVMTIPMLQHIGKPAKPIVREGQDVQRGQCIAEPDGFLSVAMHAPATGTIERIALVPSIAPICRRLPFPKYPTPTPQGTPR